MIMDGMQHSETKLYDDLSQLIKVFRRMLSASDILVLHLINDQPTNHLFPPLQAILAELLAISSPYSFEVNDHSPHKNACYRFVCRLIETLSQFKSRVGGGKAASLSTLFYEFVMELESSILTYKSERNIGLMLRKVHTSAKKFITNCQNIMQSGSSPAVIAQITKKGGQELKSMRQQIQIKSQFAQSQSNFNKVLTNLNRRFSTLACLDLDYNIFKGAFFKSRSNQKEQLYQDLLQRNTFTLREISNYSKGFLDYLKRKQLKAMYVRKNRWKEDNPASTIKQTPELAKNHKIDLNFIRDQSHYLQKESPTLNKKKPLSMYKAQIGASQSPYIGEYPQDSFINLQAVQTNKRKVSYQMKQVFITLNKKGEESFDGKKNAYGIKITKGLKSNGNPLDRSIISNKIFSKHGQPRFKILLDQTVSIFDHKGNKNSIKFDKSKEKSRQGFQLSTEPSDPCNQPALQKYYIQSKKQKAQPNIRISYVPSKMNASNALAANAMMTISHKCRDKLEQEEMAIKLMGIDGKWIQNGLYT